MTVDTLSQSFDERLQEIEAYLELLDALERQLQQSAPVIGGSQITAQQQKILYSSVYLQLYNLVEATATWCVNAVSSAAADATGNWRPGDLADSVKREWVRTKARTHVNLNCDHRLETSVGFLDLLLSDTPIDSWEVEKGGGGNWDDFELEGICERLGCDLAISQAVKTAAKFIIREDMNSLRLVKYLRNKLAHGELSFVECGDNVTVRDLRDIKERTTNYLREVVLAFEKYIAELRFIAPHKRPQAYLGANI